MASKTAGKKQARCGDSREQNSGGAENELLPIAMLAPDPRNPRKMKAEDRAGLEVSLETFGPLDIVFNTRTGELASGHQRIAALKAAGATKVIREKHGGGWGYVEHPKTGERFPVRFVDWDATKQRLANLVANNTELQGEFTPEAVEQLHEVENAAEFEALQLDTLLKILDPDGKGNGDGGDGSDDQSGELTDSWQIVVTCKSEEHQRKLLERFEGEGLECRALI